MLSFVKSFPYGDDVEIVQPLTVTVLALVEPGPPAVEDELDTLPPPAWTWTDDPPAELELDSDPLDAVEPVVPEPDDPSAVMLPSLCFSTVTWQVSPDAVLPVFSMVSARAALPIRANTAITTSDLFMESSSNKDEGAALLPLPSGKISILVLLHLVLVVAFALLHAHVACMRTGLTVTRAGRLGAGLAHG